MRQQACVTKANSKNKTNGAGRKSTYDGENTRSIYELQMSVPGPRNTNKKCQG